MHHLIRPLAVFGLLGLPLTGCFTEPEQAPNTNCEPTGEFFCDPERPNKVLTRDTCGEVSTRTTCSGDLRCEVFDGEPTCACPLVEPEVIGCAGEKIDETAVTGPLDVCGGIRATGECPTGERCWAEWDADGEISEYLCATSIDPVHSGGQYYTQGCDQEIYMHAQTTLEIDCRCNRSTPNMQPCWNVFDAHGRGELRRGQGPSTADINLANWGGGFISKAHGEFFATVHYTAAGNVKPGAIYAVNYENGDRRVVSGEWQDNSGTHEEGSGFKDGGVTLPFLTKVALAADGQMYAFGSDTRDYVHITRVDPDTGARELVWRRQRGDEGMDAAFPYGQCFSGRPNNDYAGGFDPVQPARHAFGLADDGGFFVGFNNDGTGVMKISADGSTCEILSRWASRNMTEPLPDVGGGFTPQYGTITGLLHYNGKVFAQTHDILITIDDQTGDRTAWGSGDGIGGVGEANFIVDEARNVLIACGGEAPRKCSVHHLQDGVPAQGLFRVGQAQPLLPGLYPQTQGSKGALENGAVNAWGAVVMHPDDPNVLFITIISGFIKYEINTGNNFIFSI